MKNFSEGQVIGIPMSGFNLGPVAAMKEGRRFSLSWLSKLRIRKAHQTCRPERLFRNLFSVNEDERLVKACKCSLSTTHGPIKGTLFISTKKVAFCSEKFINIPSTEGKFIEVPYKVLIPVKKVKKSIPIENSKQSDEKYLQIVTVDDFEFWFMGVANQQNSSKCREQAFFRAQ